MACATAAMLSASTARASADPGTEEAQPAALVPTVRARFVLDEQPLPQLADADWLAAWPAWLASCRVLISEGHAHRAAWAGVCDTARRLPVREGAQVRDYFAQTMDRYRVIGLEGAVQDDVAAALALSDTPDARIDAPRDPIQQAICAAAAQLPADAPEEADSACRCGCERERDTGLMTGYFEPQIEARRTRAPPYLAPVYGVPPVLPTAPRAQLEASGALHGYELLWVRDPIEEFFLEVQGSGRIHLDDGSQIRIGYAASNGLAYRSIGRWLLDHGELEPGRVSMETIAQWAHAHPQRVRELLDQNPRVVFFKEVPLGDPLEGPVGALGVRLTPGVSVAVDPRFLPLGAPLVLSTVTPMGEATMARVTIAQDTGNAIRGPLRIDWFWGTGPQAGAIAGRQRAMGTVRLFVPRSVDPGSLL